MNDPRQGRSRGRAGAGAGGQDGPPRLWDPVVRLTHWGVAGVVLGNAALTDGGSVLHVWLGWGGLSLLALRGIWGLVGPGPARFAAFPPQPRAALAHLTAMVQGQHRRYPSHNPAGALAIWAFWGLLAFICLSGVLMTGTGPVGWADRQAAAAAGDWDAIAAHPPPLPRAAQEIVKELHEIAANLVLLLAFVHVAGVVWESRRMKTDLLGPMLLGRRDRGAGP